MYQGSLYCIVYFYFPILKALIIYVSYCFISTNNGLSEATAVAQWLRCCATNRKVAGSIPDVSLNFSLT